MHKLISVSILLLVLSSCGSSNGSRPSKGNVKRGIEGLDSSVYDKVVFLLNEKVDTTKVLSPITGESIQYLATLKTPKKISFPLEEKAINQKECEFSYNKMRIFEQVSEVVNEQTQETEQVIKATQSPVELEYIGFPSQERKIQCLEKAKTGLVQNVTRKINVLENIKYTKNLVASTVLFLIEQCKNGAKYNEVKCNNLKVNLFKELIGEIKAGDSIFDFRGEMQSSTSDKIYEVVFSFRHTYFLFGGIYSSKKFSIIPNNESKQVYTEVLLEKEPK